MQIRDYETRCQCKLPNSFVDQVLTLGAGFLSNALYDWTDALREEDVDAPQQPVSRFLAGSELLESFEWMEEEGEFVDLLPFAQTIMGDYLCFSKKDLKSTHRVEAPVYFWDTGFIVVDQVAPNFDAFLEQYLQVG